MWPGRGLAVDLANTVIFGSDQEIDLLSSPAELRHWLEVEGPWLGTAPPEVVLRLADFRDLRDMIRALLAASVGGRAIPPDAVEAVNAASAAAPVYPSIDAADPLAPVAVDTTMSGSRTAGILARIARSAIAIAGGPDRMRLRVCGAPRCGRFYRASRAGTIWCSDACGNRARVARYHERRRASRSSRSRA